MTTIETQLAQQGLRKANQDESGWYTLAEQGYKTVKVWATDATPIRMADDDNLLVRLHALSSSADLPALRKELRDMDASKRAVTALRYSVYLHTVCSVQRRVEFILRNWAALMEREPWEGEK